MTGADQHTAFLRAICEDPKDDAPRLMFADWLDEHGEPERAEFVRVQCELQRIRLQQDEFMKADISNFDGERAAVNRRQDALRRRERELLESHFHEWAPRLPGEESGYLLASSPVVRIRRSEAFEEDVALEFRRGFVASISLSADVWLRHADALCAACPLEEVTLTTELEFDRDWYVGWDAAFLVTDPPLTAIDVTERHEANLIAALLAKRWPRITFHLPEDCR